MLAGLYNLNDVTFAELLYFLLSVRVWQSEYFIHSAWCRLSRAWPCWEKSGPARRAVCSLASMFLPPLIAPVTTLCYIQSSAMRGMYRSRYINCSLLKKHFLSKRPKQLNSETIRPWWQTGFTHLSSVCPTSPIETFMLQSKLTRGQ